jgi:uncharacterized protein (DUF2236 family)
MWQINREAAVLLGVGPAALLLQLAHPLVAEGVAHHSRFESDPWRRLRSTLRTSLALVFGAGSEAEAAVRRLNGIHARVVGDAADPVARELGGLRYQALDPALLLWVQATLIITTVEAYERWVGPLAPVDREGFWQEARRVGVRIGIPLDSSPSDWDALEAYWAQMLAPTGPVHVTPTARRLSRPIVRPPMRGLPGPAVDILVLPSLALLPSRLRREYGIAWGPVHAVVARLLGAAIRVWVRLVPRSWRAMPQARAADRRARLLAPAGARATDR